MKKCVLFSSVLFLFLGVAMADQGVVVQPHAAKQFATLPAGTALPEGIAADAYGNIYVSTFSFSDPAFILVFSRQGALIDQIPVPAGSVGVAALLGLAFDNNGDLFVADFATPMGTTGRILKISPPTSSGTITEFVPAGTLSAPNAFAFNSNGDLFVSDSFQGVVYKVTPAGVISPFKADPTLATTGFPAFGANGLAFNENETALFVANTGDDRILRIDINPDGSAASGPPASFAESLNGADGIAFDRKGNLWVAANQADQITVLNDEGRVIAELGEFLGIRHDGSAQGLLFPASLVIVWNKVFVTNLAFALTPAAGDEPEEDITTYTVSRINVPPTSSGRRSSHRH